MATSTGTSSLMKPWAWLAAIAVFGLVLASSTAIYVVSPSVKQPLPWWAAMTAPLVVYALVLPLCVPRLRLGGWLVGLLTLAVLHAIIALSTAWLYATVGFISFEQALPPALWGFPPALVLAMVGSLVMTLPFLGALAPRALAPRAERPSASPRPVAAKRPQPPPVDTIPAKDRQAWARGPAGAEPASAAVGQAVGTLPEPAFVAPTAETPAMEEYSPPVERQSPAIPHQADIAPDEPAVHAAPLLGVNGGAPEVLEADAPAAVPDFRQALSELFGTPEAPSRADEALEAAEERMAPDELVAPEPLVAPPVAEVAEGAIESEAMVRIPFERVMGQLPPGAFRVPLGQVGARLREAEMLVVPQALIVPQLGEGVVQVVWEVVAEQFPAAVFAVAPGEVRERIVNGRLLLPLDEIVRQLPPDVFAASIGRGPVEVPGIEGFPAPFKPLGPLGQEAPPEPEIAEAPVAPATAPSAPPPIVEEPLPVLESMPESAPELVAEPVSELVAEPVAEPVADLVAEPVAELMAAPVAESMAEHAPEAVFERALAEPVFAAPALEKLPPPEPPPARIEPRGNAEKLAALLVPWDTAALDEAQVGDFEIISVSAAGLARGAVAAAAGRLSPVIARRAPRPVEQATLRGVGGTLVLTPVGSGWNTGTALAVGLRPGGPLAKLEMLARRAAAGHESSARGPRPRDATPAATLATAPPHAAAAAALEDLEAFGPLTSQSYREPTSGVVVHCFVPSGAPAALVATFAWELAQAMAQGAQAGPLGSFQSAVLRSGAERYEIRRLRSATGPAPVLVVGGPDTGRPGLARLQVERAAARLGAA